jgi:hypothetical protein
MHSSPSVGVLPRAQQSVQPSEPALDRATAEAQLA